MQHVSFLSKHEILRGLEVEDVDGEGIRKKEVCQTSLSSCKFD